MFNRTKLQKKEGVKPTELEEDTAKSLTALEQSNKDIQRELRVIFINAVTEESYESADGSAQKYILIKIPFRSLQFFKKVSSTVIEHLEKKFQWPVIVVVNRTIDSKRKISHQSQKRPRSRTLKAVQAATLHDVVVPSSIVGRRQRMSRDTGLTEQVFLDPLDKMLVEEKIEAMADAYQKLTTHKISIEFAKPTSFQKKKLEKLAKRD
jgi:small subunit ribosomal protein S7e|mmetsp:Transcript_14890/g.20166  ORF Transcript_14890/g.20166 Transcript_14890/m.20166 type:complete len:208 (-) Transcript_14890:175-798(-)|eukprot:Macronucleus_3725.p1 GENE.Macronucleus_3725~~Macronucleus_3725.p1  ORF type:complete len:208 (+),score=103.64 Macronucleus_3725:1-624(+)